MMHKKRIWTLYLILLAFVAKVLCDSDHAINESKMSLANVSCCDKCRCVNNDVLCDEVELVALPLDCPANTTRLSLVDCGLSKLDDGDLGKHYQKLESLNISGNSISVLRNATFAGLNNLNVLDIGNNYYSISDLDPHVFSSLPNIKYLRVTGFGDAADTSQDQIAGKAWMNTMQGLENSAIETIILNRVSANPVVLEKQYCNYLKNSPVKKFVLRENELVGFDLTCLDYLHQIECIDLSVNTLAMSFNYFQLFKDLYVTNKKIREVTITDNLMRQSSITYEMFKNRMLALIPFPVPKNLQSLNFAGSVLGSVSHALSYGLRVCENNQLALLDLSNTKSIRKIGDKVLGFVKLREIHLQNNECVISPVMLSCRRGAFESLEILDISHNYLNLPQEAEENTTKVFENCTKLQYLDMSYNGIDYISPVALRDTTALRILNLSGNNLDQLDLSIKGLGQLEMLNISHNKLQTVPKSIRDDMDFLKKQFNKDVKVDVTYNPLLCSCNSYDFIEWMQAHSKDLYQWETLECTYFNDSVIQMQRINVPMMRLNCLKEVILAGTIPSGIVIIIVVISIVCYRRRYKLLDFYLWLGDLMKHRKENTDFDFDGFIGYSSLDKTWSVKTLYANLVGEFDYNICIDKVNFKLGGQIPEAITEAIVTSNKVILVITQNFLRSGWCTFELVFATGALSRRRDCLLLIMKEPINSIPKELISKTLRALLDTKIYLEWSDEADKKDVFWRKLRRTLGKPSQRQDPAKFEGSPLFPQTEEDENRARRLLTRDTSGDGRTPENENQARRLAQGLSVNADERTPMIAPENENRARHLLTQDPSVNADERTPLITPVN